MGYAVPMEEIKALAEYWKLSVKEVQQRIDQALQKPIEPELEFKEHILELKAKTKEAYYCPLEDKRWENQPWSKNHKRYYGR